MKDDKKKKDSLENTEDLANSESTNDTVYKFDPNDRFTTQDLAEINQLVLESDINNQSPTSNSKDKGNKNRLGKTKSNLSSSESKKIPDQTTKEATKPLDKNEAQKIESVLSSKGSKAKLKTMGENLKAKEEDEERANQGLRNTLATWILGENPIHIEETSDLPSPESLKATPELVYKAKTSSEIKNKKEDKPRASKEQTVKETSEESGKKGFFGFGRKNKPRKVVDNHSVKKPIQNTKTSVNANSKKKAQPSSKTPKKASGVTAAQNQTNKTFKRKKTPLGKNAKGLPRRHPKRTWVRTLVICLIIAFVLGSVAAGGVYLLYTANFTDISGTEYTPKEKTIIYSSDNVKIASLYSENRSYVSIEQVPENLRNALVATEDSRFYTHNGVDYRGVVRAFISNILGGNSTGQGASTLTQQLARLLYLPDIATETTFMDSLNRKFKEISISYQLEDKYTKNQILEMYLNEYYFGSAAYGIQAAAQTYFGKSVDQLNLAECAMLAGLPQAPSVYAPNVNFEASKNRQKQVLQRMVDVGYINQQQADEAYNTPINIVPWSENDINNQIMPGFQNFVGMVISEYAKAVAPNIMRERGLSEAEAENYARQNVASGGYKFYTTINSVFQNDAINIVQGSLAGFGYDQADGYTGSLVSVDKTGAVRSYYGGNEDYSDIDMASTARQPGSNIKPLYYSMALENGVFRPDSILNDAPITIDDYTPHNSDGVYSGPITFTQSLVQSKNVTSAQIFNALGTQGAVDWIKQFGFDTITDDDYTIATATGGLTYGLKPYQVAAAFNTFNDGGVYNQAYFIDRVTTTVGETVLSKDNLGLVSKQIISAQTAAGMWGIMQQVVLTGTGTNAQTSLPTAGKTGTTDNTENLWFTGMTGNITTSIWLGNLDHFVIGGGSYMAASVYGNYINTLIGQGLVT